MWIYRTLVFNKPMEFICIRDIVKGKSTLGIGGCDLGERTVARILAELAHPNGDFLIKVRLGRKNAVTSLYRS